MPNEQSSSAGCRAWFAVSWPTTRPPRALNGWRMLWAHLTACVITGQILAVQPDAAKPPGSANTAVKLADIALGLGPHLFLDDALIAEITGLEFEVHSPEKYSGNPVLASQNPFTGLDKATSPTTVLADPAGGAFRMWYIPHSRSGLGYHLGYGASRDGISWQLPELGIVALQGDNRNNLVVSNVIGGRVLLDPDPSAAAENYKAIFYRHEPAPVGFSVAFSADGLHWTPPEWVQELDDSDNRSGTGASDVVNAFYDPIRREFVSVFKMWSREGAYNVPVKRGFPPPRCGRRILGMSRSPDFRRWSNARVILMPDADDPPTLEFYGMPAVLRRGDLFIGLLPCLVDDAPPDGIGWTELAVSRDGDRWERIRRPFLPRSAESPGALDHAIAWASEVTSIGDRECIYYNGLDQGHKIGGRHGCLAFLRRNGFASLNAGDEEGRLVVRPSRLPSGASQGMAINANAKGGEIRVQLSQECVIVPGYSFAECDPVTADAVHVPVSWNGKSQLPATDRPLQIEFRMRNAMLYSFAF